MRSKHTFSYKIVTFSIIFKPAWIDCLFLIMVNILNIHNLNTVISNWKNFNFKESIHDFYLHLLNMCYVIGKVIFRIMIQFENLFMNVPHFYIHNLGRGRKICQRKQWWQGKSAWLSKSGEKSIYNHYHNNWVIFFLKEHSYLQ